MRRRRGEKGHVLLWTAVFGIMAMAYWALAFRVTGDCIRVERTATLRAARDASPARALAAGIGLLRTGTPPETPYECALTPAGGFVCVVRFELTNVSGQWRVGARVATPEESSFYPAAPAGF